MRQPDTSKQQAFLLVNLGTPNTITKPAIKRYLSEFLMDRNVVDLPPLLWWPILHGIVIPKRLNYIADHYRQIAINQHSPLLHYSQSLTNKLALAQPNWQVELAMTYGEPDISTALIKLQNFAVINVLFLYPQYSTTTTLAAQLKIQQLANKLSHPIQLNYLYDYADNDAYIDGLCAQITTTLKYQPKPDVLVLSYHGIPLSYIKKRSEPYVERCQLTTLQLQQRLLAQGITLDIIMSYQSQFGKSEWTKPSTSNTLAELAQMGKTSVWVMCPGFAVDCIETLYEIEQENRDIFIKAGGKTFDYIPALNDSDQHVAILQQIGQQMLTIAPSSLTD